MIVCSQNSFRAKCIGVSDTHTVDSKISYVFSIYSSTEMKLAVSKRKPIGRLLTLSSTEPWDTLKAQILVTLDNTLSPANINFQDYDISYLIPRVITQSLPLVSKTDYTHMLKYATKHNADVKVTCIQISRKVYSCDYSVMISLTLTV